MKKPIGELIEQEVRKQNIPIIQFANMINCNRNNVYNIFDRNDISIQQLKVISEVLKHNFFEEIAGDMDIINPVDESEEMRAKRKAISLFLEMVPEVLHEMNLSASLVLPNLKNYPLPDFALPDYNITFTVGDTLESRLGNNTFVHINCVEDKNGYSYEIVTNAVGENLLNIPVKDYNKSDWKNIFSHIFTNIEK
ncbi:MAG: hypothetical protein K2N79_02560 [Muribaculaceae bacterium]|nr:hypothetical protein [Muribaculaceae bacterium]